ncbi:peroxiredoxin [Streptomyces sp. SP17BM10]|uniref:peroxiredoxin n=1 Tax=Streptomyces sp. SP17BM10 TaxID=3002530 RepID=UPI002E79A023|nr:peroxiredoxin [Streptomyces sp. SP17BM10]MEE1787849.1 peroxiredoxin [Streptomyces sp. SP17BM10]
MAVEVGTEAPDFELRTQHGESVALSDFRGEKAVVLVFYPFAFTGVCTGELGAIQKELPRLQNDAVQVLGISVDSQFSQRVFADREGLDFPLLADFWPHGEVARAYGVLDEEKGCALRGTFVIDRTGTVRWSVVNGLPDARDEQEYLRVLASL